MVMLSPSFSTIPASMVSRTGPRIGSSEIFGPLMTSTAWRSAVSSGAISEESSIIYASGSWIFANTLTSIRSRGSVICPVTAVAAAVSGLAR